MEKKMAIKNHFIQQKDDIWNFLKTNDATNLEIRVTNGKQKNICMQVNFNGSDDERKRILREALEDIFDLAVKDDKKDSIKLNDVKIKDDVFDYDYEHFEIINRSNVQLDDKSRRVLSRGLHFELIPERIPYERIACAVENACQQLEDQAKQDEIVGKVIDKLRNATRIESNLTKDEYAALIALKERKDIAILSSYCNDSKIIILQWEDYESKIKELLNPDDEFTSNPRKHIKSMIQQNMKKKYRSEIMISPHFPKLYGLADDGGSNLRLAVNLTDTFIHSAMMFAVKHLANALNEDNSVDSVELSTSDVVVQITLSLRNNGIDIANILKRMQEIGSYKPIVLDVWRLCRESLIVSYDDDLYMKQDWELIVEEHLLEPFFDVIMIDFKDKFIQSCNFKRWWRQSKSFFCIGDFDVDELDKHVQEREDFNDLIIVVERDHNMLHSGSSSGSDAVPKLKHKRNSMERRLHANHLTACIRPAPRSNITCIMPKYGELTNTIAQILMDDDIHVQFAPILKIKDHFSNVFDHEDPFLYAGVFSISCECGYTYVGATENSMRARLDEEQKNVNSKKNRKSALATHVVKCEFEESKRTRRPNIKFDDAVVLHRESNKRSRNILKRIEMEKVVKICNRNNGPYINPLWQHFFDKL